MALILHRGNILHADEPDLENYIKKLNDNGYRVGVTYESVIQSYIIRIYNSNDKFYKALNKDILWNSKDIPLYIFLNTLMEIVEENNIKLEEYDD